ncbi:hypothetical protein L1277_001175 [Okibacterium sp. HSC-33S16]|uniref:hypothetical protein n=1 Tax=Okibacterium sp. HSC-33S16 TaxID=2910965 RepID=UPI0020A0C4D9|nr:hypothetical protein [Okibacterium sp. HSC-33S16]MCP2031084.1 hypothetical protein [Okibacterium sp. HSC-33S16]
MTRRSRLLRSAALGLGAIVALSACTASESTDPTKPTSAATTVSSPDAPLTVIADPSEIAASVATSRALFTTAPVVVVAPVGAPEAQEVAARAAVALGVPLLVGDAKSGNAAESSTEPTQPAESDAGDGDDGDTDPAEASETEKPLADELARLKTSTALLVGDAADPSGTDPSHGDKRDSERGGNGLTIVRATASAHAVGAAIGHRLGTPAEGNPATFSAGIAALEAPKSASTSTPTAGTAKIPAVKRPKPIDDTAAIALPGVEQLAPIATARAAGIPVHLLTEGSANPQAEASVIDALHTTGGEKTLALGAAFGSEPALDWKVRTARTGAQLPGGGQLLFADHQFVAIYGTPSTPVLGVLGEQDVAGSVARAQEVAAQYQGLTAKTVVPMFEIIATVAAGGPGPDGNFSNELSAESLRPWIDAAAQAGMYVVIDLQPGRTDFLTQAQQYQSLLELPNVGLALDPEWRLAPDELHLRTIGSVSAAEVNSVTHWLADLTNEKGLPQKMLVVHQFRPSMLTDRQNLDLSRPEIALLLHVDGQGGQADKQATWANLQRDAPVGVAWGWKNFYHEDKPMLTPEQTISGVQPTPELITYQ